MGRTKLLVREINNVTQNKEMQAKEDNLNRRRRNFARRKHKEFLAKALEEKMKKLKRQECPQLNEDDDDEQQQ